MYISTHSRIPKTYLNCFVENSLYHFIENKLFKYILGIRECVDMYIYVCGNNTYLVYIL